MAGVAPKAEDGVALPPRQPTFLARYSRNLKLGVLTLMVAVLVSPVFFGGKHETTVQKTTVKRSSIVHGAERATKDKGAAQKQTPSSGAANLAALNDQDDHSIKMAMAPDPGLTDDSAQGSMPRIGEDGREPWQVYARPFNMAD